MNDDFGRDNSQLNRISPTPITSQSSYNQAQNNTDVNPPVYSNSSTNNKKSYNFIPFIAVFMSVFAIMGIAFANVNKSKIYKSSTEINANGQITPSPLYTETDDKINNAETNNQKQSVESNNNMSPSPTINKDWKKYTTALYNLSLYYPSSLVLYKGNPADDYILYDVGIYPPKDPNSNVIKLRSTIGVSINTKSRIAGSYDNVTVNTQSGTFNAKTKSGPYFDTGGILYEFEFNKNDLYYYYKMLNVSDDSKIMTTNEFRQLIESSSINN